MAYISKRRARIIARVETRKARRTERRSKRRASRQSRGVRGAAQTIKAQEKAAPLREQYMEGTLQKREQSSRSAQPMGSSRSDYQPSVDVSVYSSGQKGLTGLAISSHDEKLLSGNMN